MLSVNGNVSFSLCRPLAFSVSVVKDEFNLEVQQYIVCRFAPEIALPALAKVPLPGFASNGAISLSVRS